MEASDFFADFLQGQRDFDEGVKFKYGNSEAYERGYIAEAQLKTCRDWK